MYINSITKVNGQAAYMLAIEQFFPKKKQPYIHCRIVASAADKEKKTKENEKLYKVSIYKIKKV